MPYFARAGWEQRGSNRADSVVKMRIAELEELRLIMSVDESGAELKEEEA